MPASLRRLIYAERTIMAIAGTCPYLKCIKESNSVCCECANFKFPDKYARRDVLYGFCAHPANYKSCTFKQVMDKYYYERKYSCEKKKK